MKKLGVFLSLFISFSLIFPSLLMGANNTYTDITLQELVDISIFENHGFTYDEILKLGNNALYAENLLKNNQVKKST